MTKNTNFPEFSTGFPIKSRISPPHSIPFSNIIKFPFARTKILTALSKYRLDHFVSDNKGRENVPNKPWKNQYPGHPEKVGTTRAKRDGVKRGFAEVTEDGIRRDSRLF